MVVYVVRNSLDVIEAIKECLLIDIHPLKKLQYPCIVVSRVCGIFYCLRTGEANWLVMCKSVTEHIYLLQL